VFNIDDLVDAVFEEVQRSSSARAEPVGTQTKEPPISPSTGSGRSVSGKAISDTGPKGRRFLSDYEVRRMLTPGSQLLRIPRGAILSPLAQDWLALKGVRAVSE
jgi:hypothetical protein